MVGQRDKHGLEDTHLLRCRSLLRGEPEGQLAKADVTNQLTSKIVTKQMNAGGVGRPDSSWIFHVSPFYTTMLLSPLDARLPPGYPG